MPQKIALYLLFCFCFIGSSRAQIKVLSAIRGQIAAPGSSNLNGIEVLLEKSPNRTVARTYTDNSGGFEFQNLESGDYEIIVRLAGYQESRQSVDVESKVDFPTDSPDGQPQTPTISSSGGLDRMLTIYIVLIRNADGASSDPDLAALRRKYSKKIMQEYEKAQEENRKGSTARAAERLEALLKQAPDFYNAHNDLGVIYQKLQRYPDAERAFKAAHDLSPASALPLMNLGALYIQQSDDALEKEPDTVGDLLDEALDSLDEAIKLEPQAPSAYYLLGTAYYRSAFYAEAETNLKRALELDQAMSSAQLILINVYLRQEKWENALEQLNAYIMRNPNSANAAQIQEIRSKVIQNLGESRK